MKIRIIVGIAFAVCAALVAGIMAFGSLGGGKQETGDGIITFESYGQIERALSEIVDESFIYEEDKDYEALAGEDVVSSAATGEDEDFSETYVQVEGVDESDIIKTDGRYIYYTSRLGYDVVIARVKDGKAEDAAVISEEEMGITADDMFLSGDRLVIIGYEFDEGGEEYVPASSVNTVACVYDVSNPEKPELIDRYRQSGSYMSARVADGCLYLVTNDYVDRGDRTLIPCAGTGDEFEKLEPECICSFPNPSIRAFAVIGSVRISSGDKLKTQAKAILGVSADMYCNGSSIYLTDNNLDYVMGGIDSRTHIVKAEIKNGKVAFAEEGSVRGYIVSPFAMDEKDGYLRIATTAYVKGKDVNYLYVLNDRLDVAGKVKGFAAGEEIKAVRYIGDTAYVITYEQTDPLFIIDLSDPESPEMRGSVKITGFSSLLLPEGDDKLIGIGTSTSEEDGVEVEDGIKIALFDVSDPENPEVLDSRTYRNCSSEIQWSHKPLVVNKSEGWYAFPYNVWDDETGGVIQFRVSGDKIEEMSNYESDQVLDRCLYIDDYIYALQSYEDEIISWKIAH